MCDIVWVYNKVSNTPSSTIVEVLVALLQPCVGQHRASDWAKISKSAQHLATPTPVVIVCGDDSTCTMLQWQLSTHVAVIYHLQHISRDEGNTFTATCWQIFHEETSKPDQHLGNVWRSSAPLEM